jgi:hypothetical protein
MALLARPWKAPLKAMTALRPVAARAILIAFSTASAPLERNAVFLACVPGVIVLMRSARRT